MRIRAQVYRKRLRHGPCDGRLGLYEVQDFGGYVKLIPVRLPYPMVVWQPIIGPRPQGRSFFAEDNPNVNRIIDSRPVPRYRWGCNRCEVEVVLAGDTLSKEWAPRDGTETI